MRKAEAKRLKIGKKDTVIAAPSIRRRRAATFSATLKLKSAFRAKLRKARSVKATLVLVCADASGAQPSAQRSADELTGDDVAAGLSRTRAGFPVCCRSATTGCSPATARATGSSAGWAPTASWRTRSTARRAAGDCERRDGLVKMAVRIGAVRPVRLGALLGGGALRFSLTCSRACTVGAYLFVPKAEARRVGLNDLPVPTPIAYRRLSGTGARGR